MILTLTYIGQFVSDKAGEVIIAGGGSKKSRLHLQEKQSVLGCLAKDGVNVALRSVTQTSND